MCRYGSLLFFQLVICLAAYSQDYPGPGRYLKLYGKAENLFNAENTSEKTDSLALQYYQQVIAYLQKENIFNETGVDCYVKCGILQTTAGEHDLALLYYGKSINYWKKGIHLPDSLLFRPFLYSGSIMYNMNNLDSAIAFYKKAEAITDRYPSLTEAERLFNKLGVLYFETGDYRKSISYYEKAIALLQAKKAGNTNLLINYKNNIASSLVKLGAYHAALDIFTGLLKYHVNEDQLNANIATTFLEMGDLQHAFLYYRRVKLQTPETFNHFTRAFIQAKQYDSAAYYNEKATAFYRLQKKSNRDLDYVLTKKYTADLQTEAGNITAAINNYQSCIVMLVPGFTDTNPFTNPVLFTGLPNFSVLFDLLTAKGHACKQLHTADSKKLSLAAYAAALSLARYVERTYSSDDARLFLKTKVNPACGEAVGLAFDLYNDRKDLTYLSMAFAFVENSKASVLQAGIQQLELTGISGLPDQLITQERKYKLLIARLTVQLAQLSDSAGVVLARKKLQETELLLATLQDKLDEYPAYRRLKYDIKETSINAIQQQVKKTGQAILSYYYAENKMYCFYITASATGCMAVVLKDDFFTAVTQLRSELQNPENSDRKLISSIAQQLFQVLVDPVKDKIKNESHLVIIPYNEVSYIPFELLKDSKDGSWLLAKYFISYQYSVNFLSGEGQIDAVPYNVLAMAPFTEKERDSSILPALPSSADEISNLPGKIIIGAAATREQFIALSGQYPLIHLATHAIANDKDPLGCYIEFFGEKKNRLSAHRLYEQEIYNLNMKNARLVILSACETGNGLLVNGEGIISLSRAFSYAGCRSVITSLWKADDASTAFIMKRLHVYLQKGFSKDEALQKAKNDYLDDAATPERYKAPYYWAHLVLIGNSQPIVSGHSTWTLSLVTFIALLVAAIYWFRKRKRAL